MGVKKEKIRDMSARQCEIAAESYAACLLAQAGYDILIQYGANQPHYDLVAVKGDTKALISVKGSQDGGWMLAVKYKDRTRSYHEAIDLWFEHQRHDLIYILVQFKGIELGVAPRTYIATPYEVAQHLKTQANGRGYGSLKEDIVASRPKSKYSDKIPEKWKITSSRIKSILN